MRERDIEKQLEPYMEKTKFVLEQLVDIRNNNPGTTVNNEVLKEVSRHLFNLVQKKMDQIRDGYIYQEEIKPKDERKEKTEDILYLIK